MVPHVLEQEEILLKFLDLVRMQLLKQVFFKEALTVLSTSEDPILFFDFQPAFSVLKHHKFLFFFFLRRFLAFIALQPVEGGKSSKNRPFFFNKFLVIVVTDIANERSSLLLLLCFFFLFFLVQFFLSFSLMLADRLFLRPTIIILSLLFLINSSLLRLDLIHETIL